MESVSDEGDVGVEESDGLGHLAFPGVARVEHKLCDAGVGSANNWILTR